MTKLGGPIVWNVKFLFADYRLCGFLQFFSRHPSSRISNVPSDKTVTCTSQFTRCLLDNGMDDILTTLVPRLVERGTFGVGHYVSLKSDESMYTGCTQFSSEITMLKLRMKVNSCDIKTVPIVVKSQFSNEKFRRRRDSASMFRNEIAMYYDILPFLNPSCYKPYPRIYYGVATGGEDFEKDVLIVENLKYSGFTQCKEKIFLDFNHIVVALRRLAEFHSWSFIEKTRNEEKFFQLVGKLEKVVRVRGDEDFDFDKMNYLSIKRGIDPLLKNNNNDDKILSAFLKFSTNIQKLNNVLCQASEPFGALVHGDFCRNNLVFKYDYKGKPIDCSYFDFQLSKYASPVVDLSFFLYLHTTSEMRDNLWDTYLRIYWDTLREYVPDSIKLPSYQEFEEHFATKAVYGYLVCSFYLPNFLEDKVITNKEFIKLSQNRKLERFVNSAGEKGQKCISDIVQHLLKKEYIHKFLKVYDKTP